MKVVKTRKGYYCGKCGKEIPPASKALCVYEDGGSYVIRKYYDKHCVSTLFAYMLIQLNTEDKNV